MKITVKNDFSGFIFESNGVEQEVYFDDIRETSEWKVDRQIKVTHITKNEFGNCYEDLLNRDAFLEMVKRGDAEWVRNNQYFDLNKSIHQIYALMDGKTFDESEREVENILKQCERIHSQIKEWSEERSIKINMLEEAMLNAKGEAEHLKIKKKIEKLRIEKKPINAVGELKKMYFAARDKSKPEISFANVTPETVKDAYGDSLNVI